MVRFDYKQNVNIQYLPIKPICTDCLLLQGKFITLTLAVFGHPVDVAALKASQADLLQKELRLQIQQTKLVEKLTLPDPEEPDEPIEVVVRPCSVQKSPPCSASLEPIHLKQDFNQLHDERDLAVEERKKRIHEESDDDKEIKSIDLEVKSIENGTLPLLNSDTKMLGSDVCSKSSFPHQAEDLRPSISPVASSIDEYPVNRVTNEPLMTQNEISSPVSDGPLSNVHSPDQSGDENPDDDDELDIGNTSSKKSYDLNASKSLPGHDDETIENFDESMELEAISPDQLPLIESAEISCMNEVGVLKERTRERSSKKDVLETISSSEEEYFEESIEDTTNDKSDAIFMNSDDDLNEELFYSLFEPEADHELQELEEMPVTVKPNHSSKQMHLLHNINSHHQKAAYDERWVEFVEQLSKDLVQLDLNDATTLSKLIEWTAIGLNFEKAIEQRQTAYKVRHLKAGIRLTIALVKQNNHATKELVSNQCLHSLLQLFNKPYMSLPVKLLLIRALDTFADRPSATEFMIQTATESSIESVYQQLIELLTDCNQTRLSVAIATLLNKLHLFETIASLNLLLENKSDHICLVLAEIREIFKHNLCPLAQRLRHLPSSTLFSLPSALSDSFESIFVWLQHFDTLSHIVFTLKNTTNSALFAELVLLVHDMIEHEKGIFYLLHPAQIKHTNCLRKFMLTAEFRHKCIDHSLQAGLSTAYNFDTLADRLTYRACVLNLLQKIDSIQSDSSINLLEDSLLCDFYNRLFSLLLNESGQKALVFCLNLTDRLSILFKLLIHATEQTSAHSLLNKTPVFHYAGKLLLFTLSRSDERLPVLFERYEQSLLLLSSHSRLTSLNGLSRWTTPLKKGFTNLQLDRNLRVLIQILKDHYERSAQSASSNHLYHMQPDIVSTVHLLCHLCIQPNVNASSLVSEMKSNDFMVTCELKHRYALIQTFSQNGFAYILSICKRLVETLLTPAPRLSLLHGKFGRLMLSLLLPCTRIVRETLLCLVTCRSNQFHDTSPISSLLLIYAAVQHVPKSSIDYERSNQIAECVIDCLRIYTQIDQNSTEIEDQVFAKTVWTKMMQELITFTLSKPQFFVPGLDLFSQLLPLPLPVVCAKEDHAELHRMINFRKLWSAHLHGIASLIEQLISHLVISSSSLIRVLMTRVCIQLSDLSSHTALLVARCFLSILKLYFSTATPDSHQSPSSDANDDLKKSTDKSMTNQIHNRLLFFVRLPDRSVIGHESQLRLTNFLEGLLRHEPFAMAFQTAYQNRAIRKDTLDKAAEEWVVSLANFLKDLPKGHVNLLRILEGRNTEQDLIVIGNERVACTTTDHLNVYFNNRTIQAEDVGQTAFSSFDLKAQNWLQQNASTEPTGLCHLNLNDLVASCLPSDYDFKERMRQLCRDDDVALLSESGDQSPAPASLRASQKRTYAPLITRENTSKAPYVAPMRGRGFQRSVLMSARTNDPFRSRPPNTSRPPSMHVDDFVALEQQNSKRILPTKDYGKYSNSGKLSSNGNMGTCSLTNSIGNNTINLNSINSNNINNGARFGSMTNRMYLNRHSYTYNNNAYNRNSNNSMSNVYNNPGNGGCMSQSFESQSSASGRSFNRYNVNSIHYSNSNNSITSVSNSRNNSSSIGLHNWNSNMSNSMNLSSSLSSNRPDNRSVRNNFSRQ